MEEYLGIWKGQKSGNKIIIKEHDLEGVSATFISGKTNKPIKRPFYNNRLTVDMNVQLDYYESGVEIELWEKDRGFYLCLLITYPRHDKELILSIARNQEDKFLDKYYELFYPLETYKLSSKVKSN